jgi:hypothetical protein
MNQQNLGSKRSASSGTGKIAAKSQETAEQLKEAVVEQANQVRDKAQSAKEQAAERIRDVATQLEHVSDNLREDDPFVANLTERASRGIERVASYVSSSSPQSVVRDAEQLARRQPALIVGSAFLLGLAAGRFLKSTAPGGTLQRRDERDEENGELIARQDRTSGFYPSAEGSERSNRRYQDNYNATFGRDLPGRESTGQSFAGQSSAGSEPPRRSTEPMRSGKPADEGNGS